MFITSLTSYYKKTVRVDSVMNGQYTERVAKNSIICANIGGSKPPLYSIVTI